jgi:hypothetical protein
MGSDEYVTAWVFYVVGGIGLFGSWWWLTLRLKDSTLRSFLRITMFILIFFPYSVGEGYGELAPGVLMLLLEVLFEGSESFSRVGTPLLRVLSISFLTWLVYEYVRRKRKGTVATVVAPEAQAAEVPEEPEGSEAAEEVEASEVLEDSITTETTELADTPDVVEQEKNGS